MRPSPILQRESLTTSASLERMGLAQDVLHEAVLVGHEEQGRCTENDVAAMSGFVGWGKPLRSLRDQLAPLGWTRRRDHGFESVVSPDGSWQIAYAAGNAATGRHDRMPATRLDKGPRTGLAVVENGQIRFPESASAHFAPPQNPSIETWFLLAFYDEVVEEIRSELSRPVRFAPLSKGNKRGEKSRRGYLDSFDPRLILDPVSLVESADVEDLHNEPIDIDVRRRSG